MSYVFFVLVAIFTAFIGIKLRGWGYSFASFSATLIVLAISSRAYFKTRAVANVTEEAHLKSGDETVWECGIERINWIKECACAGYAIVFPLWLKILAPSIPMWLITFTVLAIMVLGAFDVLIVSIQVVSLACSALLDIIRGKAPLNLSE